MTTEINGQEHVVFQEEVVGSYQNVCPLGIGRFDESKEFDSKPFLKLSLKDIESLNGGKIETADGEFQVGELDPCLFDEKQEKSNKGRSFHSHICVGGCPWKGQA